MTKLTPLIMACALLLIGCGEENAQYHEGDLVVSKISNKRGMVIDVRECAAECMYIVRFAAISVTTDTHTLSPDGPVDISPFSTVRMHGYEIQRAQ